MPGVADERMPGVADERMPGVAREEACASGGDICAIVKGVRPRRI